MFKLTRLKTVSIFIGLLLLAQTSLAAAKTEHDVKAAYLYNFIKFVTWPTAETNKPLVVCLFGEDPINDRLLPLNEVSIHNRDVEVKHLQQAEDSASCTVLFIGSSEEKFLGQIFETLNNTAVLTVSDIDDFATRGGTIGFVTMGNVIRFDVNLKRAKQNNISISSKLLELANSVVK